MRLRVLTIFSSILMGYLGFMDFSTPAGHVARTVFQHPDTTFTETQKMQNIIARATNDLLRAVIKVNM